MLSEEFHNEILQNRVISIVGSGGKTTTMLKIAEYLLSKNKTVAITTTTKIYKTTGNDLNYKTYTDFDEATVKNHYKNSKVAIFGSDLGEKLKKPSDVFFDYILNHVDYLLIESDGSKHKPLKIPRYNEPVLVKTTELVIAVFGVNALRKNAVDTCHRYKGDEIVDAKFFIKIMNMNLDKINGSKRIILLNQVSNKTRDKANLIETEFKNEKIYQEIYENE